MQGAYQPSSESENIPGDGTPELLYGDVKNINFGCFVNFQNFLYI